jgi:hypothetical protein
MKLYLAECASNGRAILSDIAMFDTVDKWIEAIRNRTTNFRPLTFLLNVDGTEYELSNSNNYGIIENTSYRAAMQALRNTKSSISIPSEVLEIKCSTFDRRLYIYVNKTT